MTVRGDGRLDLLLVVEQLRRRVPGGIGTYTRGLLQGLASLTTSGVAASLYASRAPGSPDPLGALGPRLITSMLPSAVLTRAWDRGLVHAPDGFDVVHSTSLAFPAPRGAPLAVTVHDLSWRHVPETFPRRGRKWHERALGRAVGSARLLITPSRPAADELVAGGVPSGRVEVVEEGCDHMPDPDAPAAKTLLDRLGVTGGFVLSVGTLQPRKNVTGAIAGWQRARELFPEPWPLVVVGPEGWGEGLGEQPDGVVLAGAVPDPVLSALYASARCLVYVPLHEGFGLPPVEAMRFGLPVVASPMPSTDGAAIEVDPRDVAAIAAALVRAATDGDERANAIERGERRTRQLTWARAAEQHVELWHRIK